ncbi:MAG: hypothetical protein ABI609_17235 [Acidobacteriota bacterium]
MKRPIAIAAAIAVSALSTGLWAEDTPATPPAPPATPEVAPPPVPPAEPVAPEKAWSLDLGADYASRYLFRGVSLLGDKHVLDPHAHFGIGNFGVYYYGYFGDIPDTHDKYQEADFGADYTVALGEKVSLTVGAVTYQYNKSAQNDIGFFNTYEFYGILSFDTLLTPTVTFYRDVDKVEGGYLSVGISHGFTLTPKVSLNLSGSVGFDFHYNNKNVSNGTFNDVLLGVDLPVQITDAFSLHAMVQQTMSQTGLDKLNDDPALKQFYGDQTIFTFGLAYSF